METRAPDDTVLADIEGFATRLAGVAGHMLRGYFGRPLEVEYKDRRRTDPVSTADREAEGFLTRSIAERFPGHGILGEEGREDEDGPAPDLLWALDPLDGTRNFVSGLPVYACSIGVLHRGVPVAGAVYVPWPAEGAGVVYHARRGGGAFMDDEPIRTPEAGQLTGNSLVALPAHFDSAYRFRRSVPGGEGEPRVTGSIAYEMAMVARGVLHYSLVNGSRLWDVAAGVVLVAEAGGLVMRGRPAGGLRGLLGAVRWEPVESLASSWESGVTTMGQLRKWRASLVLGNPSVARYVTAHLRRRVLLRRRLARAARRLRRGRRENRPGA